MKTITPQDALPGTLCGCGDRLDFRCTDEFARNFSRGERVRIEGFSEIFGFGSFRNGEEFVFVSSFIGMGITQVGFYRSTKPATSNKENRAP